LIPALEFCVREKLDRLLRETVQDAQQAYKLKSKMEPDSRQLFRLVFRMLGAKVLHDRKEKGFEGSWDPASMLNKVGQFYPKKEILLEDLRVVETVGSSLSKIDFRNLSVEILAYIYEKILVDEDTREGLGIHSTPSSIARYIVHHLPIEDIPENERRVVEPCCGHSIFLVAALQRLRELLPGTMTGEERHQYFVKMLSGFEIDAFALEVGKLCLMLADLPNHNDWRLHNDDVFTSPKFISDLKRARVVLCNPPFEKFKQKDYASYENVRNSYKPIELLNRILEDIHQDAMVGFVLPQKFLDGRDYRRIRRRLFERFAEFDLVSLPDRVFHISQHETALLIAKSPVEHDKSKTTFTFVKESDRQRFLDTYTYTWQAEEYKTLAEAENTIASYPFRKIWERLSCFSKLKDIAKLRRGLEITHFDPSSGERQKILYSGTEQSGFKKGYSLVPFPLREFRVYRMLHNSC